jgi:hypothetical protein
LRIRVRLIDSLTSTSLFPARCTMVAMFIVFYGHRDALCLFPAPAALVGPCAVLS